MANYQTFTKVHKWVFKVTGGRIGAKLAGLPIVMIETVGRKSGQLRIAPVACYPHKDFVAVVASNNGQAKNPVWWLNLQAQPKVAAQLGRQRKLVEAQLLEGEEREQLWAQIIEQNPRQKLYAAQVSERVLPVVYLKPLES